MKLLIVAGVVAQLTVALPQAVCQDAAAEKLSLAVGRSSLQADSIERGVRYPSVIQLRGNVQITSRTVVSDTPLSMMIMVVRADEADYHEDTGEIEARGSVQVTYRDDPSANRNGNVRIKLEKRSGTPKSN
jgi:lipopolysaccharide assembly outer membrane protein LptD (OstA)